jgi:hypothetical protein
VCHAPRRPPPGSCHDGAACAPDNDQPGPGGGVALSPADHAHVMVTMGELRS